MKYSHYSLLFLLTIMQSCSTCSRSSEESIRQQMENAIDSLTAQMEGELLRDSIDMARAAQLDYQIDSIVAQDYNENGSATNYYLYVNKHWDKYLELDRNGLAAVIYNEIGDIALISTLPDIHPFQHNHVEISVGAKKYIADTSQTRHLTGRDEYGHIAIDNSNGEVLHIDDSISMKIVQDIVAHPTAVVTITASYRNQVYATYTLSDADKKAIIASYKLLLMIKERNALEGGNVEWDD